MDQSRAAAVTLASGRPMARPEVEISGPFLVRLATATLTGLAAAALAAGRPVETFAVSLVLGAALLLLGAAALAAGAVRHRRAARGSYRAHLNSGRIAENEGAAFLLWFAGHAAVWAGLPVLASAAALRSFGPGGIVLVASSGCAAAAAFSLAGLVGRAPLAMLGLCWERFGLPPAASALSRAEIAVVLRSRFLDACERDATAAGESSRLPTFTRLQIALDLARTGRSGPRVLLQGALRESAGDEISGRSRALVPAAAPAAALTSLLVLLGLLGLPSAFDPGSWPATASLSGKARPEPRENAEESPAAADSTEARDDEAPIEPAGGSLDHDEPPPALNEAGAEGGGASEDEGREASPKAGEDGTQAAAEGTQATAEGTQAAAEGTQAAAEGTQGEAASEGKSSSAPDVSESRAQAGEGAKVSDGERSASSGEAASGPSSPGEPARDEGGASGSAGESPTAASPSPGRPGNAGDADAEAPGETPSPGQGAAGGGAEDRPPSAARDARAGSGSGRGEAGPEDAWGLGDGSPLGEAAAFEPPAASDVVTLRLPVLGSQTVRLEDDEEESLAAAAADAPRGTSRRRRPVEPPVERAEPDPRAPQQPLPAWIVRLLRGKG